MGWEATEDRAFLSSLAVVNRGYLINLFVDSIMLIADNIANPHRRVNQN